MSNREELRIRVSCAEEIRAHGAEAYPNECCGALLGRDAESGHAREIIEVLPLINRREDSPQNRFAVSPRDVIEAEKSASKRDLKIVGWYHSHPDHPARPSEYDRESAWPWYSYIIVSVRDGVALEMASWRLAEDGERYVQEHMEEVTPG
jgi:proteasome lid subunit RPN8/RPN11